MFEKTRAGKSHKYMLRSSFTESSVFCPYENEKLAFSNSSGLKSVLEKLRRFRDGLVYTVDLTVKVVWTCLGCYIIVLSFVSCC